MDRYEDSTRTKSGLLIIINCLKLKWPVGKDLSVIILGLCIDIHKMALRNSESSAKALLSVVTPQKTFFFNFTIILKV